MKSVAKPKVLHIMTGKMSNYTQIAIFKRPKTTHRRSERAEFENFRKRKNKEILMAEGKAIRDFSEENEDEYFEEEFNNLDEVKE